ncbi:unnamed protein product [Ambrosiozyma monospora]|uniref:Unnamed protein product n=1 Tax=Ambrosiozyma monospora TaxID=43982 RepID=A0ACB5SVT8_AMBMO|nr:unnamed protein product [Ambrosiozyma monospora]
MSSSPSDIIYYGGNTPSFGGNVALLVFMFVFLLAQLIPGILYKLKFITFFWTIGTILELIGYAGRVDSSKNMDSAGTGFKLQLVCLSIGSIFIVTGMQYIVAMFITSMGGHFSPVKPQYLTMAFLFIDLVAFVLQIVGSCLAATKFDDNDSQTGADILAAGCGVELLSLVLSLFIWGEFWSKSYASYKSHGEKQFNIYYESIRLGRFFVPLIWVFTIASLLLVVRTAYRLAEAVEGFTFDLTTKQIYPMILHALMVSLALLLLVILHPGYIFGKAPRFKDELHLLFKLWGDRSPLPDPIAEQQAMDEVKDFRLTVPSLEDDKTLEKLEGTIHRMGTVKYHKHDLSFTLDPID